MKLMNHISCERIWELPGNVVLSSNLVFYVTHCSSLKLVIKIHFKLSKGHYLKTSNSNLSITEHYII